MLVRLLAAATLFLCADAAMAAEFKTVGPAPAILYDAPSQKGNRLFVAPAGMPVEVVVGYGDWVKVRDVQGDLAWTEAHNLSVKRAVVVRAARAALHSADNENAPVLMTVDKGVVLELVDPQVRAWLEVRYADGQTGFIKASDVWGI